MACNGAACETVNVAAITMCPCLHSLLLHQSPFTHIVIVILWQQPHTGYLTHFTSLDQCRYVHWVILRSSLITDCSWHYGCLKATKNPHLLTSVLNTVNESSADGLGNGDQCRCTGSGSALEVCLHWYAIQIDVFFTYFTLKSYYIHITY